MKTPKYLLALTMAVAGAVTVTHGQNWETVDENPFPGYSSGGGSIVCAPNGSVFYSVGRTFDDGTSTRYLRYSLDQGAIWLTTSPISQPFRELAVDRNNNLYLAGDRYADGFWYVLKSTDSGLSWIPIFEGNVPSFRGGWGIMGLAADAVGAVYVVGDYEATVPKVKGTVARWAVRKGVPDTTGTYHWTEVDTYSKDPKTGAYARCIAISSGTNPADPGEIFVGGQDSSGWVIRRSRDAGVTWATVDSFPDGNCLGVAVAPDGSVFATGNLSEGGRFPSRIHPATGYTVIRKGTPDPAASNGLRWTEQWRKLQDFDADNWFGPKEITVDRFGGVCVVGSGAGPSSELGILDYGWRVWASMDGVGPYYLTDYTTDGRGGANSVASDFLGNVFISGTYSEPANNGNAVAARVRRLPAP